ncbi:MAG: ribonuclease P protein component [Eubacteriales bacterium]|nr:ribonuclease P protein component [Eubacteriales bacterium]
MRSIKKNSRFRTIYSTAKSRANRLLVIYRAPGEEETSRLGITVSGKIGHAVVRNRIRRRIREAVRLHEERFLPGYDIIFVARKPAAEADYHELEASVLKLSASMGLLKEVKG